MDDEELDGLCRLMHGCNWADMLDGYCAVLAEGHDPLADMRP